jgi:hypothetical protein
MISTGIPYISTNLRGYLVSYSTRISRIISNHVIQEDTVVPRNISNRISACAYASTGSLRTVVLRPTCPARQRKLPRAQCNGLISVKVFVHIAFGDRPQAPASPSAGRTPGSRRRPGVLVLQPASSARSDHAERSRATLALVDLLDLVTPVLVQTNRFVPLGKSRLVWPARYTAAVAALVDPAIAASARLRSMIRRLGAAALASPSPGRITEHGVLVPRELDEV